MIVCLRTVAVPAERRSDYLAWIRHGRAMWEAHGILPGIADHEPINPSRED
jgi:hypothetical protein